MVIEEQPCLARFARGEAADYKGRGNSIKRS